MAEAVTENTDIVASTNADNASDSESTKNKVLEGLGNIDLMRQVVIILSLTISLALLIFVMMWAYEPDMRPLGKMETQELIETLNFLDQNKIDYKIDGNTVMVKMSEYQNIRLLMTRAGLINDAEAGDSILMQDMGFGVSQRLEGERLKYSREQQLAKAIEALNPVKKARVLLAIPKQNVFARQTKQPSATVVVSLASGRALLQEEVDSIVDIVASAVHGMAPGRVTVTDQTGRLLNSGSQDPLSMAQRREYELERKREQEYLEKIDTIMIPTVGIERYTAQVDVDMDFTAVEQTHRSYNPDLPAIRSEMTVENVNSGDLAVGIPGALTNQPPLDANIPEEAAGGQEQATPTSSHREATRNYELDTTISHTRQQIGVIRRLSVSVAVDYNDSVDAEGNPTTTPRTQQELDNIRRLLQGGLGFSLQRGDTLEVVTVPFVRPDLGLMEEKAFYDTEWFRYSIKWFMLALVCIALILGVMRPMLKRLTSSDDTQDDALLLDGPVAGKLDDTMLAAQEALLEADNDELISTLTSGRLELPDLHRDEDVLKAVRALVANEPELAVQVVKSWLEDA
ncbi:flagellar M-ring protein FliF [Neiella sp. HB171785]|uniref:Flagellar M-ring protein n=1 Tax=Neiella litorisoli TaxID=2771431 RepID=A0A8J6QV30_9GAMM|nr:flagellar M-ring protein FliF [Neiella litorisoli]